MAKALPLLELASVSKFYAELLVFKGVSFSLSPGSVLLVAGPNGSGKSTLLKLMAGLLRPTSGRITRHIGPQDCGFLGHHSFLYPKLTAAENLSFWAGMHGLRLGESEILEALKRVGLAQAAQRQAGVFSRGMTQRLSLARAFLSRPKLLFLDEPDTGLDVASRLVMQREIAALKESGGSVVWVSHDLSRDLPLADSLLRLENSRQVYFGQPKAQEDALC